MAKAMKKAAATAPPIGQWLEVHGHLKLGEWGYYHILLKAVKQPAMKKASMKKKAAKKPAMKAAMKKAAMKATKEK